MKIFKVTSVIIFLISFFFVSVIAVAQEGAKKDASTKRPVKKCVVKLFINNSKGGAGQKASFKWIGHDDEQLKRQITARVFNESDRIPGTIVDAVVYCGAESDTKLAHIKALDRHIFDKQVGDVADETKLALPPVRAESIEFLDQSRKQ